MSNKEAIKKLLLLLVNYKKVIAFVFACLIISTGLNLCIPLLSRSIMDDGFIGGNQVLLVAFVVLTAIIYIADSLINIVKEKNRVDISAQIEYSLSEQAFAHLMRIKPDYFNKTNYAEILNNSTTDISNMTSIADPGMFFVISSVFSIAGGIAGLFIVDWRLTFLVLLFIPFKWIAIKYFAKKNQSIMNEYIGKEQEYSRWFGDTVGGINEIKLFNLSGFKYTEYCDKKKKVIEKKKKMNMMSQWNFAADTILIQLLMMVLYIVGANMVFSLEASIGSIFAFISYSCYVTSPISAILNIGYMLSGIIPSTKRFYQFLDIEEEERAQRIKMHPSFGDLEFKEVCFSYELDKPILQDISLKFPKGSKTVLMGKNGSGKSTILGLITRMYEPQKGNVLLSGINIQSFLLDEFRSMIAVVNQQIYLFNDSIRNNICLYKGNSNEDLAEVIIDCGLKEFVDEVTLDYIVGNDGSLLSGGQKQKIALARAIVHDKPIVIFDEATSNTDVYSEMQINSLMQTKLKSKTVIIVSHKQKILSVVDNIVFLDNTRVTQGNYEELYKKDKSFKEMVSIKEYNNNNFNDMY